MILDQISQTAFIIFFTIGFISLCMNHDIKNDLILDILGVLFVISFITAVITLLMKVWM